MRFFMGLAFAAAAFTFLHFGAPARGAEEGEAGAYPLSLELRRLERDVDSDAYRAVLETMISTDLAAEWQRVATADNYLLFETAHGGADRVAADPALRAAHARRKEIAERYLALLGEAYARIKRPPPFADAAALERVLRSAADRTVREAESRAKIEPIFPAPGAEHQWPAFRGPTGRGYVADPRLPPRWSATENVLWRAKLPGRGNSSPVVWGDRVFVTAEGENREEAGGNGPARLLLCHDRASGELLWKHAAPEPVELEKLYWKNTFASSTPVTDGERVVAFFGAAGLVCCDLEGKQLWHVDLGPFPTMHGPGSAPVIYSGLVIVIQDQTKGDSLCAAFRLSDGAEVWRRSRPGGACWCTPVLLRIDGRDELVFNGSHRVVSYDPATGEELWSLAGPSQESIPMIAVGEGLLYSVSGRNGPMIAIRPGGAGDVTASHTVWRQPRGGPHVPSPIVHDGKLFQVNDTGILQCLNAATGELLSQQRLGGRFSMSPLLLGDRLLLINEEGRCFLVEATAECGLLGEFELGETVLTTPAVLGGRMYVRTADHLLCIGEAEH